MRTERRGHAEFNSFDREVRQGRMIKPSVDLQELRRRIYRKAKAEKARPGCGWKRWSNETIYKEWGLVDPYEVRYFYRSPVKALPAR